MAACVPSLNKAILGSLDHNTTLLLATTWIWKRSHVLRRGKEEKDGGSVKQYLPTFEDFLYIASKR